MSPTEGMTSSEKETVKKARKRTKIDKVNMEVLLANYEENPRPTSGKIATLAEQLGYDPYIVRVWFTNRRQKMKKMETKLNESTSSNISNNPDQVIPDEILEENKEPMQILM